MKKWFKRSLGLVCLTPLLLSQQASAEGRLTVYCTVQNALCEKVTTLFGEKYNVKTEFVHGGTETIFGKIKAEKDNPQADFWYGGTIEPHFQAGELGLLEAYRSPKQAEILPQFKSLMEQKGEFTSVAYMLVLGFGVNTQKLAQLGLPAPKTWEDLLKPEYKGEIAFDYLKKLNENVSQYVKSNLVTANLSRGESAVSVGFVHAYATEKEKGAPVETVIPEGKTGYALGGASIIKGARNLDNAKLFMDFVLSKEVQEIPWREFGLYQIPSNANAQASPKSVDPKTLQLLDFDFVKFGSKDEGKRLINKWLAEIKLAK